MTECTKRLVFPFFKGAQVTTDFSGGAITSDGGLLLVREFDERIGLSEGFSKLIPDPRDLRFILHDQEVLIRQRLYQVVAGYEDANDATLLRRDPIFKAIAGRCPEDLDMGSQPTFSRLENRIQPGTLEDLNDEMVRTFIRTHTEPLSEITLDIDPSEARTYGQQELTSYNGHYDSYMYFPQFVCDAKSHFLLAAVLRAGKVSAANGAVLLLSRIMGLLRAEWPKIKIYVRADSNFAEPYLLNWLEEEGIAYTVGIGQNKVLEALSAEFVKAVESRYEATQQSQRSFTSLSYQTIKTWAHPRRVVVKVEVTKLGTNVRYVVATKGGRSQDLYEWYTQRGGTIEDVIEQLKNGFEADRMSCHRFEANAFRLLLHSAAYNLMLLFREQIAIPELKNADIQTIRIKLIKVGRRVERTARRIWIRLSSSWPFAPLFRQAFARVLPSPSG
ncbi:MAG TPA: IS1380 family transposase [Planctomycetota bacterium]|nr:IS1380 family transposase [Planctomycetota bacterium]